jgi:hypothetical protein
MSCSTHLVDFVIFAATCLIGEIDPRCLMQMLQFLFQLQSVVEEAICKVGKEKISTAAAANIKGFRGLFLGNTPYFGRYVFVFHKHYYDTL